ncbi:MAG: hypothetical protein FJ027_07645 [Candidatus Rokubacteria bacterium]|nr:hypothetical protein [Candidatus Rokubacteria bacterium]
MKRRVAIVLVGLVLIAGVPLGAEAHGGAALGLAAFAAFTVLTAPFWAAAYHTTYAYPVYHTPPAYYPTAPAYYAPPAAVAAPPPAPAIQREVVYAHGRHVLLGDGVRTAYQWVWVPNPPPPPAAPPAPAPPAP